MVGELDLLAETAGTLSFARYTSPGMSEYPILRLRCLKTRTGSPSVAAEGPEVRSAGDTTEHLSISNISQNRVFLAYFNTSKYERGTHVPI